MPRKNNKKKNQKEEVLEEVLPEQVTQKEEVPFQFDEKVQATIDSTTNNANAHDSSRKLSHGALSTHRRKVTEQQFILNEHLQEESLLTTLSFIFKHSIRDISRRKFHYTLAFLSVFIVVLSSLVINTIVEKGPIIFFKLSESHHGQIDGHVFPFGHYKFFEGNNGIFLNYSRFEELYSNDTFNLSPRKYFCFARTLFEHTSGLYNASDPHEEQRWFNTFDKRFDLPKRDDLYNKTNFENFQFLKITGIKTEQERNMELGREYDYPSPKFGECYWSEEKLEKFAKRNASIAIMKFASTILLTNLVDKYNAELEGTDKNMIPTVKSLEDEISYGIIPCKIVQIEKAKYDTKDTPHWGDPMYFDYDSFLDLFSYYLPEPYNHENYTDFQQFLRRPKLLDEYADLFVVNLPHPRLSYYESSDLRVIRASVASYLRDIEEALGFFPVSVFSELLNDLSNYSRLLIYIGLIFDIITLLLITISILLIYSLLIISIETKTFDIGVQRMVGLSKKGIITIVLVQSFLFVVPAVITGFLFSIPTLAQFSKVLTTLLRIECKVIPTKWAASQALIIGLLIPLLSSIIPIRVALKKNLNDALDYQRSKTQAVFLEVLQKGKRNLSGILSFGIFACAYGISVYYLLPLALVSFNLSLILKIFVFILFGMLFAMTLIALNTQRLFEIAFTYIFLFIEYNGVKIMVLKNLMAHRSRNQLTTIIYSLGLGFIIFLNVAYKIQIETLRLHERRFRSGEIQVDSMNFPRGIKPTSYEPFLKLHEDKIEQFTWMPPELARKKEIMDRGIYLSDYSRQIKILVGVYGVQPNFFDAVHQDCLTWDYYNDTSLLNPAEQLYTARGSQSIGVGSLVTNTIALDPSNYKDSLIMDIQTRIQSKVLQLHPMFTTKNVPGYTMTDLEVNLRNKQMLLMNLPMFSTLAGQKISEINMERLIIKLKDPDNLDHTKILKTGLRSIAEEERNLHRYEVYDIYDKFDAMQDVDNLLSLIFGFVIPITMFLCFFSLSASMTANLLDQGKEIGVLRAIGFQEKYITRLYVYEAFILVISSSVLGVLIGSFMGWIMTLQQGMFLQIPLTFIFPLKQFLQISCFSIVFAFLSTYGPARSQNRKSIGTILRNG